MLDLEVMHTRPADLKKESPKKREIKFTVTIARFVPADLTQVERLPSLSRHHSLPFNDRPSDIGTRAFAARQSRSALAFCTSEEQSAHLRSDKRVRQLRLIDADSVTLSPSSLWPPPHIAVSPAALDKSKLATRARLVKRGPSPRVSLTRPPSSS